MNATVIATGKTVNETTDTMTTMTESPLIEIPATEMFETCGTHATRTIVAGIETIATVGKGTYGIHAIYAIFEIRVTCETETPATCETPGTLATGESPTRRGDSMTGDLSRAPIHAPTHALSLDRRGGRHPLRYQRRRLSSRSG